MMAGIKHPARTGRATCSPRQFYWGLSRDPMAETNGSNSRTGAEKGRRFVPGRRASLALRVSCRVSHENIYRGD
jgi:hypothetical protein